MDGCSYGTCARWPRSTSVRRREHDRVRKHARPSAQRPTTATLIWMPRSGRSGAWRPARGRWRGSGQGAGGGAGTRGGSGSARRPPDRRCATPCASGGWGCRCGGRPASYWDHGAPTPRPTANRLLISRLVGVNPSFPDCDGARQRFTHVAAPFADTFLRGDVTVASDRVQPRLARRPPRARLRGGACARRAPAPAAPDTTRDTANNRPFHGPHLSPVALAICPSRRFLRTRGLVPSCAAWSAASGTRPRHAARWAWAVGLRC